MATGDQSDMTNRLLRLMPAGWFPSVAPRLNAVLQGFAYIFAQIYTMIFFTKAQMRVSTAQGGFLDLIAQDYFGVGGLTRLQNESDAVYAGRIKYNLTAPRGTRAGLEALLTQLLGANPEYPWQSKVWSIWQPNRGSDCGFLGSLRNPGAGGGTVRLLPGPYFSDQFQGFICSNTSNFNESATHGSSAWGTLLRPCTTYVLATPIVSGLDAYAGYAGFGSLTNPAAGGSGGLGAFSSPGAGGGLLAFTDPNSLPAQITISFVCQQIADWTPVGYQVLIGFVDYIP